MIDEEFLRQRARPLWVVETVLLPPPLEAEEEGVWLVGDTNY